MSHPENDKIYDDIMDKLPSEEEIIIIIMTALYGSYAGSPANEADKYKKVAKAIYERMIRGFK